MRLVGIGVVFVALLACVSYWAYGEGLSRSNTFEAVRLMVIVQEQEKCFTATNIKCARKINRILFGVIAAELQRANIDALSPSDREVVEQFIEKEKRRRRDELKSNRALQPTALTPGGVKVPSAGFVSSGGG